MKAYLEAISNHRIFLTEILLDDDSNPKIKDRTKLLAFIAAELTIENQILMHFSRKEILEFIRSESECMSKKINLYNDLLLHKSLMGYMLGYDHCKYLLNIFEYQIEETVIEWGKHIPQSILG